jgi:hypothetical protein
VNIRRVPNTLAQAVALAPLIAGDRCIGTPGGNVSSCLKTPGTIEATPESWWHELPSNVNTALVMKLSVADLSGKLRRGAPADLVFEKPQSDAFEASGRPRPSNSA